MMMRWIVFFGAVAMAALAGACADDGAGLRPLGATCGEDGECASGHCVESVCVDPGAAPVGAGTCPGVRRCVDACALGSSADAASACSQACFRAADSEPELMAADQVGVCMFVDGACSLPPADGSDAYRRAYYACQRASCSNAVTGCWAMGAHGADGCAALGACIDGCGADMACAQACAQRSTEAALASWVDWDLCVRAECAAGDAACVAVASGGDGACAAARSACFSGGEP